MKNLMTFLLSFLFFTATSFALEEQEKNVAMAKLIKGEVKEIMPDGESRMVKKEDWIKEGSVVKTAGKSFVQLKFVDNSVMNVGPGSELVIERFSKSEPGVINVIKGKIRSQVTKNYLEMEKNKSKLFIKSNSAVMGIRGTDFLFASSALTGKTTAILFEGSVVFNKIDSNKIENSRLESIVSKGRRIMPGQFSVVTFNSLPTVPAKLSSRQFNKLFKNVHFANEANKKIKITAKKSVVPPGLNGAVVSGTGEGVTSGLRKIGSVDVLKKPLSDQEIKTSKGYVKGDDFKPVDGSLVHLESGTIIPIPKDAEFDKTTGEWVSNTNGGVDKEGHYIAPEGYAITSEGKMIKKVVDQELQKQNKLVEVIIEAKPLDQNKSLDELPVRIIDAHQIKQGHGPAAGSEVLPVVQPLQDNVLDSSRKPSGDSDLPPPPRPEGTAFKPAAYDRSPPIRNNNGLWKQKTRVKFNISR